MCSAWVPEKGFGFLQSDEHKDLFVHRSSLRELEDLNVRGAGAARGCVWCSLRLDRRSGNLFGGISNEVADHATRGQ